MIVVSACLAGMACRYDGCAKEVPEIKKMVEEGKAIAVCPEQMGGLTIPRTPSEIQGHQVISKDGKDVTEAFYKGADKAFYLVRQYQCDKAVLKSKSPSCGCGQIYDGSFSGNLKEGNGIFAQMLIDAGIPIYTED